MKNSTCTLDQNEIIQNDKIIAAHLDDAHIGDIKGAWGTIRKDDTTARKTLFARLITLLVIMGPGLIAMIGDNDAGGIATYIQAGQNYGTTLLWTLLILIPVLVVNQEMSARLGVVTKVGHARLIFERFGKFWGAFSVFDLFLLNFLTIITEFIGFSMGLQYFGVGPDISVPIAIFGLIAITISGSYRRWEGVMWICCVISLAMIPLIFIPHPNFGTLLFNTFIPTIRGGINSTALLTIVAIVGTTVAPWQLFFQQSNVIDKRLTPRWLNTERVDTIIGSILTNVEAAGLIIVAGILFTGTKFANNFVDVITSARGFAVLGHPLIGTIVAIILINASIVGACTVTLSTSYAFGDVFNIRHSLHRKLNEAKLFYGSYAMIVLLAGSVVLIPHAPLGLITLAVQALAGILLPSATVFLVLLCNDRAVLGPWVNKAWLNIVSAIIVGLLVVLSVILAATTLFTLTDSQTYLLTGGLFAVLTVVLITMGIIALVHCMRTGTDPELVALSKVDKTTWTMPPLQELTKPAWSLTRKIGMSLLRGYLAIAVILLVVKIIQLAALGH